MQRIYVVGPEGVGKTAFASRLAAALEVPHVDLDGLCWELDGTKAPTSLFVERTRRAVWDNAWVADGNHREVRDVICGRADMVVWLDFSPVAVFAALAARALRGAGSLSAGWRESRILWHEHAARFTGAEARPHRVVRLRSARQAEAWLEKLPQPGTRFAPLSVMPRAV